MCALCTHFLWCHFCLNELGSLPEGREVSATTTPDASTNRSCNVFGRSDMRDGIVSDIVSIKAHCYHSDESGKRELASAAVAGLASSNQVLGCIASVVGSTHNVVQGQPGSASAVEASVSIAQVDSETLVVPDPLAAVPFLAHVVSTRTLCQYSLSASSLSGHSLAVGW